MNKSKVLFIISYVVLIAGILIMGIGTYQKDIALIIGFPSLVDEPFFKSGSLT